MKTDGNEAITQNYQFFIIYSRRRGEKDEVLRNARDQDSATFVISVGLQKAVACVFV
jgi:hypothetical protein